MKAQLHLYFILLYTFFTKETLSEEQLIQEAAVSTNEHNFTSRHYSPAARRLTRQTNLSRKRKSELMCEYYAKTVDDTVWIQFPMNIAPFSISVSNCDKNWSPKINALIAGGVPVILGEFPHMAIIFYMQQTDSAVILCAGTLISEKWILTAAHCALESRKFKNVHVELGRSSLEAKNSRQIFNVKNILIHPEFRSNMVHGDVGLLELSENVTFGLAIKPACLQVDHQGIEGPQKLWVTGWGSSSYGGQYSVDLMKAELDVISNTDCSKFYNNSSFAPKGINDSMICAADFTGNWKKDTCPGDSGGPLQMRHPDNCLYKIFGITSKGKYCGIQSLPGVYTRISSHVGWIENMVWPDPR